MKKVFLILTSLVVVGCTTTPVASPLEPVPAIKTVPETILPKQKTSIFYYYVHPVRPAQSAAVVEGNFA